MITAGQWADLPAAQRKRKTESGVYTYIPSNRLGISCGYYLSDDLILMLRRRKADAAVVQFILDMLE